MILSCGTLSYRQESLPRALEGIARAGFRWVEIGCVCGYCEHIRPEAMGAAATQQLHDQVASLGLQIASLAGHVDLKYPLIGKGAEAARQGYELLRARIDLASRLQVGIVNTGIGATQDAAELDAFYREFADLVQYAEDRGVRIGLESHAGLTETAVATLALCQRLGRTGVGVNYDPGNVHYYTGQDAVADLASCADAIRPWLIHVHIKDHRGGRGTWDFPPLGEGDVNLAGVAAILKRIGYAGPCSLEIEFRGVESQDPSADIIDRGVAESLQFMQALGLEDRI